MNINPSVTRQTVVAIIPARGGSKGVPGKNIKNLNGKPLLAYSIQAAKLSKLCSRVIVSTDSEEIAAIAKTYGAEVPFIRPTEISGDKATDYEFFKHAIDWFHSNEGDIPEYFVHLRPTTPLRESSVIDNAIQTFISSIEYTALRSVHEMSESAYKCFEIDDNVLKTVGTGSFELDNANRARQAFPKTYSANGYVDIVRSSFIIENGKIHGNHVLPFITNTITEVDTIDDFKLLEFQIHQNKDLFNNLFKV